jgi:uncharacterized protein with PQ loop repeat
VYIPQIILIYKNKSSEGISLLMLFIWTQADILSLFAAILSQLSLNVFVLGYYDVFTGFFMILFSYYYSKIKSTKYNLTIMLYVIVNVALLAIAHNFKADDTEHAGEIIGWITSSLYLIGRIPQIYINSKSRNVEGLSILMFIYTILGNFFYLLSIFTLSIEKSYIMSNLPWITTTIITILLDIFVIFQILYYKKQS